VTDQGIIEWLWKHGYFRDPSKPDVRNVTKRDLFRLTRKDEVVRQAISSSQDFGETLLEAFVQVHHGRALARDADGAPDGEPGPATFHLWSMPRCNCPDYAMLPEDDEEVAKLWNPEEANWPDSCRNDLKFGRDFASLPGLTQEDTDGVYWAMANNLDACLSDVEILPDLDRNSAGARGWDKLEAMSGGTLAWNYLAQNNCGVQLQGAWNSNVRWDKQTAATTGTHEKMHWLGANHSKDATATIYYAITAASKSRYGFPNATDIGILKSLGYSVFDDWESRKPSLSALFKPRGTDTPDEPKPPSDVEQRLLIVEAKVDVLTALYRGIRK